MFLDDMGRALLFLGAFFAAVIAMLFLLAWLESLPVDGRRSHGRERGSQAAGTPQID